ncbi:hypothetical protein A2303_03805 [Candidatus Falkowbacteria bacterium RIFOXYB2_FULL_47_14]|uniref:HTH luxR-type domain-containing protein n=1 Tax=Candidatus Falkowbacteria bacterium RIFOXYA2_FULL_47_19 TaxID=1797994 RepID=A0A1F5SHX9_9BACT|nr:MAG: hypothetical protein A2227_03350 [Candidatus Falkowbacteria bacterium RIFOXYA2_FULL_47_19]OGF37269.1 MAG: hypothetical protein A2468_06645 [Candidatus Falkowbacteria bacterium RIFOXYC2_FULL_46_15]OGF42521.1 MAG: hypothetical protein A2303_03805 [Candidatus Falkowbacteria bacterium RIFOXYB2_FULL_47_14]
MNIGVDEISAIKQCQAGDPEKFGVLYDKYIKKIYDFVYYKTHHRETAEDLTSRIFMKALENIGGFDPGKGTFQAWIYRIARNTVIDHYRTSRAHANIEDVWDLSGNDDPERDIDAKTKLEKVRKYLAKLKPIERDIVIMRVWQGMNHKEIAAVMGKTEAGVKMAFSRTITKLREEMPLAIFLSFFMQ